MNGRHFAFGWLGKRLLKSGRTVETAEDRRRSGFGVNRPEMMATASLFCQSITLP
jgi:hypothetical protein